MGGDFGIPSRLGSKFLKFLPGTDSRVRLGVWSPRAGAHDWSTARGRGRAERACDWPAGIPGAGIPPRGGDVVCRAPLPVRSASRSGPLGGRPPPAPRDVAGPPLSPPPGRKFPGLRQRARGRGPVGRGDPGRLGPGLRRGRPEGLESRGASQASRRLCGSRCKHFRPLPLRAASEATSEAT